MKNEKTKLIAVSVILTLIIIGMIGFVIHDRTKYDNYYILTKYYNYETHVVTEPTESGYVLYDISYRVADQIEPYYIAYTVKGLGTYELISDNKMNIHRLGSRTFVSVKDLRKSGYFGKVGGLKVSDTVAW